MKPSLVVTVLFFVLNFFYDVGKACNSHYGGGYGLFGDDYVHGGNPYVHMNVHGHGHHHHGHGYHGGLIDSLFRTDIGGGSHHHHHHRHSHLIPLSHHRHVHRIHRRSTHSRRSRTMST